MRWRRAFLLLSSRKNLNENAFSSSFYVWKLNKKIYVNAATATASLTENFEKIFAFHCLFASPLQRRSERERGNEKRGKIERERTRVENAYFHATIERAFFFTLSHTSFSQFSISYVSGLFSVGGFLCLSSSTHPSQIFIITSLYVTHMHMCCCYKVIFSFCWS